MAARWVDLHPENPQARLIGQVVDAVRGGAVIAYPTESGYSLGCHLDDRAAADRLRRIRNFDKHHQFTLMCRDLSEIARYARVDNTQFRLLKSATPGAYTFVLDASKELPKRIAHERRKTIGIRVPTHPVARALLDALDEPLIACTLQFPGEDRPVDDPEDWREQLTREVDWVLTSGHCGVLPTTVVDLTGAAPEILRQGSGPLEVLGL